VLVVHGSGDSTVPASEALTYQDARRSGKGPTQLEIIDKADHTYASLTHTQQVLELVKKFFGENL
jgi:dipeptidyl aminopeptidase/acylaminoacyl peptidase